MEKKNLGSEAIQIQWRIDEWFPQLGVPALAQLKKFHEELLKFNKTVNLISVKTIPTADLVHFADSILACQMINKNQVISDIYDFGSGNGFPGLVQAILFPKTKVKLVEIDQRKAEFLKHAVFSLGLKNVEILVRAIEDLPPGSVEFAMSRGFAGISKALLSTRKVFKKGGKYFHLKSEEWASEVASIPSQLCSYWTPALMGEYKLPIGNIKFAVVTTEKVAD